MNKRAKYICITIIFLCLILISTSLDVYLNTDSLISIITKICITIICIVIIRKENILKEKNKTTSEDIAVALIPMTFSILLIFGPINKMPNTYVIISGILGAFTTAVWEELSYRVIGTKAIEDENEKLKKQEVTTGKTIYGSYIEIKTGLSEADYIAFPYGKGLKDGAHTTVQTDIYY